MLKSFKASYMSRTRKTPTLNSLERLFDNICKLNLDLAGATASKQNANVLEAWRKRIEDEEKALETYINDYLVYVVEKLEKPREELEILAEVLGALERGQIARMKREWEGEGMVKEDVGILMEKTVGMTEDMAWYAKEMREMLME